MSEDTYGTGIKLSCGHWVYIKQGTSIVDGCVRCRKTEMKSNNDRRPPRR